MVGNKAQKAIVAALTGVMTLSAAAPAFAYTDLGDNWYRVDGKYNQFYAYPGGAKVVGSDEVDGVDRYDTMIDAIETNAEDGIWNTDTVVLVSGESYADTLAASALAGAYNSPIITTPANKLGIQAERALKYFASIAPGRNLQVYAVGGSAAIADKVLSAVDDIDEDQFGNDADVDVVRLYGSSRQETSIRVMEYVNEYVKGGWYTDAIFVANGDKWMDALSVSSYSYMSQFPIILTNADGSLTTDQVDYLQDALDNGVSVYVIGGSASVAYQSLTAINKKVGNLHYIAGDDRYDTSKLVVESFGVFADDIAIATGENWPDALVGGAFIGVRGGTLVLSGEYGKSGKNWNAAVKEAIKQTRTDPGIASLKKFVLGGKKTFSDATVTMLKNIA